MFTRHDWHSASQNVISTVPAFTQADQNDWIHLLRLNGYKSMGRLDKDGQDATTMAYIQYQKTRCSKFNE